MGLLDFIKGAGAKVFGDDDEKEVAAQPPTPEEIRARLARKRSAAISRRLTQAGLDADGVSVHADGDRVTLSGSVANQEAREKLVLAAGNVAGVAAVDDQLTVENPEPEATFYTVQSGDSLSKIAKEVYGDAMKYPVIFEANKPMLEGPGQDLPRAGSAHTAADRLGLIGATLATGTGSDLYLSPSAQSAPAAAAAAVCGARPGRGRRRTSRSR